MSNPRLRLIYLEDWVGVYLDGKLIKENHSIQENDLIHLLRGHGLMPNVDYFEEWPSDWPPDEGRLPSTERELDELLTRLDNREATG